MNFHKSSRLHCFSTTGLESQVRFRHGENKMQNRIDTAITVSDRDKILDLISQIFALLPMRVDLSPEERQSLVKMGDSGRPFVEQSLNLVEQDDSFMPRAFDKTEMRQDSDFYTTMLPVSIQMSKLHEAISDTMLLTGSDLMMAGLEVYRNAKANGEGAHLDNLVPLLGKRFKLTTKKDDDKGGGNGTPPG